MTNETLKTIAERYSCRDFTGAPLTGEQVKAIAKAALASPSAMNRMPWHVMLITDKAFIDDMDAAGLAALEADEDKASYERVMQRGGKLFYNAPCMVMVASDGSSYGAMDCGILSQNVALAAHALGLGSVICGMAGIPISGPSGDEFKKRMQFPCDHVFGIAVLVGAANSSKEPHEFDLSKLTYID